jgi:hypothetical protein
LGNLLGHEIIDFWDTAQCILIEGDRRLRHDYGGSTHVWNVCLFQRDYTAILFILADVRNQNLTLGSRLLGRWRVMRPPWWWRRKVPLWNWSVWNRLSDTASQRACIRMEVAQTYQMMTVEESVPTTTIFSNSSLPVTTMHFRIPILTKHRPGSSVCPALPVWAAAMLVLYLEWNLQVRTLGEPLIF